MIKSVQPIPDQLKQLIPNQGWIIWYNIRGTCVLKDHALQT